MILLLWTATAHATCISVEEAQPVDAACEDLPPPHETPVRLALGTLESCSAGGREDTTTDRIRQFTPRAELRTAAGTDRFRLRRTWRRCEGFRVWRLPRLPAGRYEARVHETDGRPRLVLVEVEPNASATLDLR